MADETKLFTVKLLQLKNILEMLQKHKYATTWIKQLDTLETRLIQLQKNVENEGTLNAGGKFEWVDSVLIKCLQDGCWLLVENVNLCSPAVLDRLNGLLEPNGVLTIGERGVDNNGEMINITPHPNFRLFLTMDPKNGEISRAMRNRGVEIYILNDIEQGSRNEYDTKTLIEQNGINIPVFQNLLIQFHDFISDLTLGEKPTISHILQASFLISQQFLRGINVTDAFTSALIDVYVKTKSVNDFNDSDPINTIESYIKSTLKEQLDLNDVTDVLLDNKTLKTVELQADSSFETVKQHNVLIKQCLNNKNFDNIYNYFLLCYLITSKENLQLKYSSVSNLLNNEDENCTLINDELFSVLRKHFTQNTRNVKTNMPLESRFLPDTIETYTDLSEINQIFLLLHFVLFKMNRKIKIDEEVTGKKFTKMTVLQYSKAVHDKKISQYIIEHPLIVNFYRLILTFDDFLISLLQSENIKLTSEDAVFAAILLNWRFVLQEIGNSVAFDKKNKNLDLKNVLSQLIVRYKWFKKHTVDYFMKFSNKNIGDKLETVVKLIGASMEDNFSNFVKISKRFTKINSIPLPLTSEEQITTLTTLKEIESKSSLTRRDNCDVNLKYDLILNSPEFRQQLFDALKKVRTDYDNIGDSINQLKEHLNNHTEKEHKLTEIQLLPITDLFGLFIISDLRNRIFTPSNDKVLEKCQILRKINTIPLELIATMDCFFKTRDEKLLHELTLLITLHFKNAVGLSPSDFLFWNKISDDDFKKQNLTSYVPALTYCVTKLCISDSGNNDIISAANLGKYNEKTEQLRYLNELLWQNIPVFNSTNFNLINNDVNYVINSFEKFIKLLEKSLTGKNENIPISDAINICINKIDQIYKENKESQAMMNNKNKIMHIFNQLCNLIEKLKTAQNMDRLITTANVYCLLNYIKALFNSQLQVIDPLEKIVLKKKYCTEERNICSNLKEAFVVQNEIYSGNFKTLHPFCAILAAKIKVYEEKEADLEKHVAVRPGNLPYQSLLKDVTHNLNTLLSEEFFLNMHEKLNVSLTNLQNAIDTKSKINLDQAKDVLSQSLTWLHSQENSYFKLSKYRIGYPDIVEPLLSNIMELSYGIKILNSTVQKLVTKYENLQQDINVFMKNLIQFPVLNESQRNITNLIELCTHNRNINFISKIIDDENVPNIKKQESLRMLKCGIQELYNLFVASSPICLVPKMKILQYLENLISLFVSAWYKQETETRKKLEEQESLYKTKTKCNELSEEEEDYKNMKLLFPNFHEQDFSDFQQDILDDSKIDEEETSDTEFVGLIKDDDINFVSYIYSEIMNMFTKNEWLNPKKKHSEPNYVTPLIQRFKLFNLLQNRLINGVDNNIECTVLPSLNLLVAVTKNCGDNCDIFATTSSSPKKSKEKNYDFYKDPNVEEVKSCLHIMESLKIRILELLSEWSGHPTLNSIIVIIERVFSFPISSPVSRFLTGLEILLSKCQEWEENAHSGVSLAEHSQNITHQIIAWRKLELAGWKDCLNNTFNRVKKSTCKYWFHIYSTIVQFIEDANTATNQIIKIFQEFIEKSSLGEFETRLNLLYTFHCHSLYLPKSERRDIVVSLLWNLYNYYAQFSNNVDTKIKNLRSPIEKKLKDFVKIARWNDINYWSIKEAVEKTHRTLHKYIKEFENILKGNVTDCLVNTATESSGSEQVGIWDRPTRHTPSQYHYSLESSNYVASIKFKKILSENIQVNQESDNILNKLEKYFTKSRNLCKDVISSTTYPNLIQNLDSFVSEVIETSNHLRNLDINKELTKPKQKSQAKSILQQKRKALSDLFKNLTKCGLSHRTGLIEAKLRADSNSELLLKPLDLNASFSHMKNKGACDGQLLNVWDGCETYFNRTIVRLAALDTALKQPAQDLGLQNIERCKGYSYHLMILAQEQKEKLIESSRNLYYLRHSLNQLSDWNDVTDVIKTDTVKLVGDLITNIIVVMEQYKIVLLSCPEQSNFESDLVDIPVLDTENQMLIKHAYDQNWDKSLTEIKIIILSAQKLKKNIDKLENIFPSSELQRDSQKYVFIQDKNIILTDLRSLFDKMDNLQKIFGDNSISNSLKWLLQELTTIINIVDNEKINQIESSISTDNFKNDITKLVEYSLLIIQNIYKKYNSKSDITIETTEKGTEEEQNTEEPKEQSELFEDNHLKKLVIENLFDDISILEMKSMFRKVKKLINKLYKINVTDLDNYKNLLSHFVPLLEQIVLLYQYFITQQISAYRVTCKISSVLLNIFIELSSKGFCVPEEFSDELNQEGQSTQSGGMGLGDGEGEKDVSDRIESEDQLDDAQPAGQEKKNEDKDCKEEEKGIEMSEDFEGKLQDLDKPENDESESNSDSDAEKQMGETEPESNKLDQQIWGSDEELDDDDNEADEQEKQQDKEERGEGGELEDQQMAAKEDSSKTNEEAEEDNRDNKEKKKEQQKDINEMDEPEYDEEHHDPYHGNQPPLPEPEPMDLPDDLQLDDGEEKEEQPEENPFDIDSMKEQMPPPLEEETEEKDKPDNTENTEDKNEDSSDSSDEEGEPKVPEEMETDANDDNKEDDQENKDDKDSSGLQTQDEEKETSEDQENNDASALDNQQSKEDEIQPMDIDNVETADNVQTNPNQNNAKNPDQVSQEESEDKAGVGQTQMEDAETGHKGEVKASKDSLNAQNEKETPKEKRQKPGESDSKRSLGEMSEPVKKKLKTVDIQDKEETEAGEEDEGAEEGKDADMYQHIKEAKETDTQVMDAATEEQAKAQKIQEMEEEKPEEENLDVTEMDTDEPEADVSEETPKQKSEKTESKSEKKADGKQQDGDIVEEIKDVEIEGNMVETITVPRGNESSYHTQYELLNEQQVDRLSTIQIQDLRSELEHQLGSWNEPPASMEAEQTWEKFSAITSSLARDLSEQLRLVLEPTQASRLRGDFRIGRRINMRKIIPYIASQFRKDKIWLRRTKPSKREYQIALAIDDSSSMDDNHSKELAFESVALISKALSLLESGQLSVLSFGETTEIVHKLTDTFTEKSGIKLLQKFQFQQTKTCIANLVDFVTTMFSDVHTTAQNAKLLVVVSDGRGIFSEGETIVQQAIRRAKFDDIFMVFVIIDSPENKNSILDIRMPVFKDGKLLGIKSYLDNFPFSFYIILRDINALPSVLSDALRQWFELVTNADK